MPDIGLHVVQGAGEASAAPWSPSWQAS